MPADLFRSSVATTPARRRASLLPLSIGAHVIAIGAAVLVPVVVDGQLPQPARAAPPAYIRVEMPTPPPVAPPQPTRPAAAVNTKAAPLDAPAQVLPETGLENLPMHTGPVGLTDDIGVPGGDPNSVALGPVALPPPPPLPPAPVPIGGQIRPPAKLRDVRPVYPAIAQQARVQGMVIIEAVIGIDGRVEGTNVLRGHPLLNDAAVAAVRQWTFTPTLLNNQPVPVVMTVTVDFRLQ
jgi:periplasmic protein TonB